MGTSFAQKLINLGVQLAPNTGTNQPNTFVESGTDTATISGLRTSVRVSNSGAPANCTASVKVWGMTPSMMNQLSTLGLVFNLVPKNQLTILAGDAVSGMTTIFTGTIFYAYADYSAQPMVPFVFECNLSGGSAVLQTPPSSFQGATDVATIFSGIARQMGAGFENNGVNVKLYNVYLAGSARQQAAKLARMARISWGFVNGGQTLAIWPLGGNRNTPNIPTISAETGMISYPSFTQQGIKVRTLFNPLISFGSLIKVESTLLAGIASVKNQNQSGASTSSNTTFPSQWAVNKLDLALDSMLPKGEWMSEVWAYNPGYSRTIIAPGS